MIESGAARERLVRFWANTKKGHKTHSRVCEITRGGAYVPLVRAVPALMPDEHE